jgi:hypothetical protein
MHASGGIRNHDPSKRLAADLRLRPRGHWNRPVCSVNYKHHHDTHNQRKNHLIFSFLTLYKKLTFLTSDPTKITIHTL